MAKRTVGVSFYNRGPISFQEGGDSPAQETRSVRARCQPGPHQRIERSQKREERHRPDTRSRKITVPFYTFIRNELLQRPTFPRCSGLTVSFDSVPENSNAHREIERRVVNGRLKASVGNGTKHRDDVEKPCRFIRRRRHRRINVQRGEQRYGFEPRTSPFPPTSVTSYCARDEQRLEMDGEKYGSNLNRLVNSLS